MAGERFEEIFNRRFFTPPEADPKRPVCTYAQEFIDWTSRNCRAGTHDLPAIYQTIVMLTKKFRQLYYQVPEEHRRPADEAHYCVFDAFMEALGHLEEVELELTPRLIMTPPLPPELPRPDPPAPQLYGIVMGEGE